MRWSPGDVVALRYLLPGGRISWVKPMRVVEDSDALVALFIAAGTPLRRRVWLDGKRWERWRPDARWAIPSVDPGWESVPPGGA